MSEHILGRPKVKVTIVGAGTVGTAIAYACLIRGSAEALALYDTNADKVRAEVLDLNHGTQFAPPCRIEGGDDLAVTAGSDMIVVTAGAKQKPGQSRLELAAANVALVQTLTPALLERSPDAVVLFVSNPVDIVTHAAIVATDAAPGRIFGSGTVLDSGRLRFLIAERAGVAVENVHAVVVGEHGDSEITLWSGATIGGVAAAKFVTGDGTSAPLFDAAARADISARVVHSAYEIIRGKGATNLAIGLSTARIVEAVLRDQHRVLPVSTLQSGPEDLSGVCLSLPTVVDSRGAAQVLDVAMSDEEREGLRASARTLREVQATLER
ncbi:L-lactate dehydrogenase [Rhodococcus sp. HM1]|uniref:L-lactate dehydrogenase n=1 Tax=unclassified Rhodococcus (in: high G+C Gram-positive bacteria) TaxID=192944 RepID=UPI0018CF1193|nr:MULTISPECIES: L-lactate dehydrogenase [unclassified Rhodococcus (in: high G+C Gram-positive bacteria)]MBH0120603.1 L-lactate dehydrogenase [Rhodococcus sp. CX]MCK8673104.1 L-lactate dehydrogenase [Rhodococcus sp. HM1]